MTGSKAADVAREVGRECGECVLCCIVHGVPGTTDNGERCKFLRRGTVTLLGNDGETSHHEQRGCTIYDKRPRMCRTWFCAWLLGLGSEADRPDRTGVIPDFVGSVEEQSAGVRLVFGPEDLYPKRDALVARALKFAQRVLKGTAGAEHGWGPMKVVGPIGKIAYMKGGYDPRVRLRGKRK